SVSGSRDFYGRAYHGWLPAPCSGYANHPNRAIDGKGTRTPPDPTDLLATPFTCVRLSHPYLTRSLPRLLTMTFTTAAFGRSSSWRFEASSYKAAPKGPPSSFVQHDADRTNVFMTQCQNLP